MAVRLCYRWAPYKLAATCSPPNAIFVTLEAPKFSLKGNITHSLKPSENVILFSDKVLLLSSTTNFTGCGDGRKWPLDSLSLPKAGAAINELVVSCNRRQFPRSLNHYLLFCFSVSSSTLFSTVQCCPISFFHSTTCGAPFAGV